MQMMKNFDFFFRLNRDQFAFVQNMIQKDLRKHSTNSVKNPISPKEKSALTLR